MKTIILCAITLLLGSGTIMAEEIKKNDIEKVEGFFGGLLEKGTHAVNYLKDNALPYAASGASALGAATKTVGACAWNFGVGAYDSATNTVVEKDAPDCTAGGAMTALFIKDHKEAFIAFAAGFLIAWKLAPNHAAQQVVTNPKTEVAHL